MDGNADHHNYILFVSLLQICSLVKILKKFSYVHNMVLASV